VTLYEIIAALPNLTVEELSAVRRCLRKLDEQTDLQFLHNSANALFQDLDKQETKYRQ
jgi:hypothetical protein